MQFHVCEWAFRFKFVLCETNCSRVWQAADN
jgi:hypothetical protein